MLRRTRDGFKVIPDTTARLYTYVHVSIVFPQRDVNLWNAPKTPLGVMEWFLTVFECSIYTWNVSSNWRVDLGIYNHVTVIILYLLYTSRLHDVSTWPSIVHSLSLHSPAVLFSASCGWAAIQYQPLPPRYFSQLYPWREEKLGSKYEAIQHVTFPTKCDFVSGLCSLICLQLVRLSYYMCACMQVAVVKRKVQVYKRFNV